MATVVQIRKTSKYSTLEIYSKKLLKGYLHKGKQGWGGINASCNNQYMLLKCAKRFDRPHLATLIKFGHSLVWCEILAGF